MPIRIFGVNAPGLEQGNSYMTSGRSCPWLQDTGAENVWAGKWAVNYRDVVILDAENRKVDVYNLTDHNLYDAANFAALKNILIQASTP